MDSVLADIDVDAGEADSDVEMADATPRAIRKQEKKEDKKEKKDKKDKKDKKRKGDEVNGEVEGKKKKKSKA